MQLSPGAAEEKNGILTARTLCQPESHPELAQSATSALTAMAMGSAEVALEKFIVAPLTIGGRSRGDYNALYQEKPCVLPENISGN